jgi:nucleotide-binding universal stress UspA family protein
VIVALDGSVVAEQAIPFARALANRWHAPLHLVHVRNPVDEAYGRDLSFVDDGRALTVHTRPGAYLAGLAESLRATTNLGVATKTLSGVSIHETLRSVCRRGASALVIVRTQRSALSRFFNGNVADELIGRSPVPLLAVPASQQSRSAPSPGDQDPRFTRILTYLDGSEIANELVKHTVAVASDDAMCQLLKVLPLASLFGKARGEFSRKADLRSDAWLDLFKGREALERRGIFCKPRLVFAGRSAPSAIVDRAQASRPDLIVMAAQQHVIPWWLREAVVENVIRRVSIPVLVVPKNMDEHSLPPARQINVRSN